MAVIQSTSHVNDKLLGYSPVRVMEIDLEHPLSTISAFDEKKEKHYQYAWCLVRLHAQSLGLVKLEFDNYELSFDEYMPQIWQNLRGQINEHLQQDGLALVTEIDINGLISLEEPLCIKEREKFFAIAPFVSIIVSTHDRTEQLSICLPSLLSQHYPCYEVIIVDNAPSTSATADLIKQTYSNIPNLRYVCESNPGLSFGLNRGIMVAKGEILAFTDDDVVVDTYWLIEIVKAFGLADDVNCVTGLVLPLELETPAQILFEEYGGFSKGFSRCVYDMTANRPQEPLYPYTAGRFGTGASMAFRSTFLRNIGGFDPALQCGMDIAAFFMVVKEGYKLVYEPKALAYHTHRRIYTELRKQIYNYGVALTAYLTKCILEDRLLLLKLLMKIPYGFFFTLSTKSLKNQKKLAHYPRDLNILEIKGMLYGPFVYVQGRWALRHLNRKKL